MSNTLRIGSSLGALLRERLELRYARRAAFVLAPIAASGYQPRALWLPLRRALWPIVLEVYT